jgi:uncharacterized LabA/DUF88 family protein
LRISFLVDGFNLYHSLSEAQNHLEKQSTKWLNLKRLCCNYLYLFGKEAKLQDIYYFSALAVHRENKDPEVTNRHNAFIKCLVNEGIKIELSRFKKKENKCPSCGYKYSKYEEKETDVKLALKLLELFITDSCDIAVFISGDTDLAPCIKTAKLLFPNKEIAFIFPYKRHNRELEKLVSHSFKIKKEEYTKYQFANPCILKDGSQLKKPLTW